MDKDKEIFLIIYEDDESQAYIADSDKIAINQVLVSLKENSPIGTKAKIYDLTNAKYKTISLEPVVK